MKLKNYILILIFASGLFIALPSSAARPVCVTNTPKDGYTCSWALGKSWCGNNTLTCQVEPANSDVQPNAIANGSWSSSFDCNTCAWTFSCSTTGGTYGNGYQKCGTYPSFDCNMSRFENCSTMSCSTGRCTACASASYNLCSGNAASPDYGKCVANTCAYYQTWNATTCACVGSLPILQLGNSSISNANVGTPVLQSASPSIYIPNTGYVGIGTSNPTTTLDILSARNLSIFAGNKNVSGVALPQVNSDAATKGYVDSATVSSNLWTGTKNGNIWNGDAGVGNVGIGTNNPGAKLDIVGGSIRTDGQLISTVGYGTAPLSVISTTTVTNLTANYLGFGSVGATPSSSAFAKLTAGIIVLPEFGAESGAITIRGWNKSYYSWQLIGNNTPWNRAELYFRTGPDSSWGTTYKLWHSGNLTNGLVTSTVPRWTGTALGNGTIYDNGTNVGIGTTNPGEKLVVGSGNIKLYSKQNIADQYRYIGTEYDNGNGNNKAEIRFAIDGVDAKTRLTFHTANGPATLNEIMRITSGGNVGIGTTSPATTLDIVSALNSSMLAGNKRISNVDLPTANSDAATKGYVDSLATNIIDSSNFGRYVGMSAASSTGDNTGISGATTGYDFANNTCSSTPGILGSHVCTSGEMVNSVAAGVTMPNENVWIFNGPPGFTVSSNDCNARTVKVQIIGVNKQYGTYWEGTDLGFAKGRGLMITCENLMKLACCK